MKIRTIIVTLIVTLIATLCLIGCSKDGSSSAKAKRSPEGQAASTTPSTNVVDLLIPFSATDGTPPLPARPRGEKKIPRRAV